MVTDLAVLGYHPTSRRMEVHSLHPGVQTEQVVQATGFALTFRQPLETTQLPTSIELGILRDEVDPHGYIIGRG